MKCPSGDTSGLTSIAVVATSGSALPDDDWLPGAAIDREGSASRFSGNHTISPLVRGEITVPTIPVPSARTTEGDGSSLASRSFSGTPDPSAASRNTPDVPPKRDEKTIVRPSGDHTGRSSRAGLKVNRVKVNRVSVC